MTQPQELQTIRRPSTIGANDFYLLVARGLIAGHSTVVLRGHNPSQSADSGFVDVSEFGNLTYLTSAETMNIVSSDTDDTAAGTGARTGLIIGVDGNHVAVQEVFIMNGTTNVLTTQAFLRVNTMVILTAGSSGWNEGTITATASSAATVQQRVGANASISMSSHYTVPAGQKLHVMKLEFNVTESGGSGEIIVEFHVLARPGGAARAWIQFFDKKLQTKSNIELDVPLPFPTSDTQLVEKSDFRMTADTDKDGSEISTRMYGILIDD